MPVTRLLYVRHPLDMRRSEYNCEVINRGYCQKS